MSTAAAAHRLDDPSPEGFLACAFPDASAAVRSGTLDIADAERAACLTISAHLPNVIYAFGYGSVFRGRHKPYSDVDVMAFVAKSGSIVNYCFMSRGVAVDLHLVGLDQVDRVIAHARRTGVCSVLSAVTEGRLLIDSDGHGEALRQRMASAYADPPGPALERERRALRWTITSQLSDIAQDRPSREVYAAALTAYPLLIQFHQAARGGWRDRGKWTVASDRDGSLTELIDGYAALFRNDDKTAFLGAALRILEIDGGPLCLGQGNRLHLDTESAHPSAARMPV